MLSLLLAALLHNLYLSNRVYHYLFMASSMSLVCRIRNVKNSALHVHVLANI